MNHKGSTIGDRIKNIRNSLHLSQKEFAEKLDLSSPQSIQKYESNNVIPPPDKLIIISKMANVSIDWIILGKEYSPSQLNQKEYELLSLYREIPEIGDFIIQLIKGYADIYLSQKSITEHLFVADFKANYNSNSKDKNGGKK